MPLIVDEPTVKLVGGALAAAASAWGIYDGYNKWRQRQAQWLQTLYEKFYEKPALKDIRDALDCRDGEPAAAKELVERETGAFTDYLNFFEFVAVLERTGQLRVAEIDYMFGYYLDCLERSPAIRAYLPKAGYEQLDGLLDKRKQRK